MLAAFLLPVAPAVAGSITNPKSGTYKGTLAAPRTDDAVTLTVSHGKLTKATLSNIPLCCSSGGPATQVKFAGSKIAPATGAFSTTGKYSIKFGPYKGKVGEKLKLSGASPRKAPCPACSRHRSCLTGLSALARSRSPRRSKVGPPERIATDALFAAGRPVYADPDRPRADDRSAMQPTPARASASATEQPRRDDAVG